MVREHILPDFHHFTFAETSCHVVYSGDAPCAEEHGCWAESTLVCRVAHVLCFLLICCLVALSVIENRLLKVDSPQWLLLNCPFHPSLVWFASRAVGLYCETHILYNGYIFLTDSPAIIIKRPSLSLVTVFVLKPLLPHMVESLSLLFTVWFIWFILLWRGLRIKSNTDSPASGGLPGNHRTGQIMTSFWGHSAPLWSLQWRWVVGFHHESGLSIFKATTELEGGAWA